jgi:hypothetical protein
MLLACAGTACSSKDKTEGNESPNSSSNNHRDGGGSSSNNNDDDPGSTTRDGGGGSTSTGGSTVSHEDDNEPVSDDLTLLFNPMYSAYDGVHTFKLPAIVQGGFDVRWSARPADSVDLEPDSATGGVMITTRAAGDVLIIARTSVLSGSAMLHITDATPDEWEIGSDRYNNEIPFPMFDIPDGGFMYPDGGFGDGGIPDGGFMSFELPNDLSCRNCHGATAQALDVEHTPQQTGGYSDDDLIKIFTMGMKPEGAKFHTPFPPTIYERYHTWEATDEEKKGLVVYLRSLEPKTQGMLDFQGLRDTFGGGGAAP